MSSTERFRVDQMAATKSVAVPGRTAPEVLREPKKKGEGIGKGLRNTLIAATALTALGGVGYAAYENIPAVHQSIDKWKNGASLEERFPIKLDQSLFTPVSKEEEQKLWQNTKTVDLENHTFTIGFPVDQATIDKSPNLRMNSYFDPEMFAGGTPSQIEKLRQDGIKNVNQLSGLPKDTSIAFDYDQTKFDASIIAIGIAGVTQGQGSNSFTPIYTNYLVIQKDRQNGREYQSIISVLYGKPLVQPAPYPRDYSPVYENGTPIKPDEPILQLTTDIQDGTGQGRLLPGQGGQITYSAVGGGEAGTLTPIFLKTPTGNVASKP